MVEPKEHGISKMVSCSGTRKNLTLNAQIDRCSLVMKIHINYSIRIIHSQGPRGNAFDPGFDGF